MIYLECYSDEALVKAFGVHKKGIFHSYSKGNVCKKLEKGFKSKGLVDEDPFSTQPSYVGKLKTNSHEYDIKLLYDEIAKNHLIVLCPRLEDWILKAAKEAGINIKEYSLPDDANELHKIINTKLDKFIFLIEDIKKRSNMLITLEKMIRSKQ